MDRLQSMKIFACVVESGGFTAAAEQLGLSQAQVTRHVAALESELGLRLLERTTRRMRLTEIGEAYLERCRRILALVEEADAIGEAHRGEPRGVLRLTAAASFARVHLAPAIAEYMQQYPETAFELILSDRTLNMVDEGIDLSADAENCGASRRRSPRWRGRSIPAWWRGASHPAAWWCVPRPPTSHDAASP